MSTSVRNVMLIDDEEIDRKIYQRVIQKSGIVENVLSFSYADEALEFLKQENRQKLYLQLEREGG